ncbi:MAG: flippase-like domain-containing protein [Chloroflexi bacterium]|nr:flippase-like domain-containing protein [Chloroflexota bacterium]
MLDRRFWLGLIASASFIALLLWRIDFQDTIEAFWKANYLWLLPAVAFYFVALYFRTLRWGVVLRPLKDVPTGRLFPVMAVGYMANNLLPVRLGELVRSYYFGQREGVSKTATLGTIAIERVLDGVVLLAFLAGVSLALPLLGLVGGLATDTRIAAGVIVLVGAAPFLVGMSILVLAAYKPRALLSLFALAVKPLPKGLALKLNELAALFFTGLAVLRDPRRVLLVTLLTVPVWLGEGVMYYIVAWSFGLQDSLGGAGTMVWVMLAVTATSNLATALPSSQGGIGPFELFATATLVVLGAPREQATAYAVVLHVALLVPVTLLGLAYLWAGKQSLVQMVRLGAGKGANPGRGDDSLAVEEAR